MGTGRFCGNRMCDKLGNKACSRCRTVLYCSRECQVTDYPSHRATCKELANPDGKAPEELTGDLSIAEAQDVVQRATWELDGRFSTTSDTMPENATSFIYDVQECGAAWRGGEGSSFLEMLQRSNMGGRHERVLRAAGVSELYADALGRIVAGRCWIPLLPVCTALFTLILSNRKICAKFARAGGIAPLTRVLECATDRRAWRLVEIATNCVCVGMELPAPFLCDLLGAAGTLPAVVRVIQSGAAVEEAAMSCSLACLALFTLDNNFMECRNERCSHIGRVAIDAVALLPALDRCLQRAVDEREWMPLIGACRALAITLRFNREREVEIAQAITAGNVCENLVTACSVATSPQYLTRGQDMDARWSFAEAACRAVGHVCFTDKCGIPKQLRVTCVYIPIVLHLANRKRLPYVQVEACMAIFRLSFDDGNRRLLVGQGVLELVLEALAQAVARPELERCLYVHMWANDALRVLLTDDDDIRRLPGDNMPKDAMCRLFVDSLKFMLERGLRRTVAGSSFMERLTAVVDYWPNITAIHLGCRKHFRDAGANEALTRALAVVEAEGDAEAIRTFRDVRAELSRKLSARARGRPA